MKKIIFQNIWPYVGLFIAFLTVLNMIFYKTSDMALAFQFQLIALLIHQFEEYVLPGGFAKFYNNSVYGKSPFHRFPINYIGVYLVNILLGWTAYIFVVFFPMFLVVGVGLALVNLANAIAHISMAFKLRRLNPGTISSATLLLPSAFWVIWLGVNQLTSLQWLYSFLFLVLSIASMYFSIMLGCKIGASISKGSNSIDY